jgi:hypothetical protein
MHARRSGRLGVVRARQFVGRAIGARGDGRLQQGTSTGEVHPPALTNGSTVPVVRWRRTHRCRVGSLTEKSLATIAYVSLLDSYARTARSRNSVGYGLGMRAIDHRLTINSSEFLG